jgi:putative spermidine/putrescine transport system substrate-binding protein
MKMKWHLMFFTVMVIASLVLTACGGAGGAASAMKTEIGKGEGEVAIVDWPGYVERGANDKNFDWVTKFEADTGCKVTVKEAATSDEMVTLMNQGGFDLVTASGDASLRLIAGGTVQPINIDLIPSWKTVDARLQNAPWHTVNGIHYGVPYQWGPNVLMYNTKVFPEAPKSWGVVFVEQNLPDGKTNSGRVQAPENPIYLADAALYLKATKPELGIKDPYELTQVQFDAVVELLRQQRKLVPKYWHDATTQVEDFTTEGIIASSSWPYQVNLLITNKQPVSSTFPTEGATGWADTTMMNAKAPHPNCAYLWLEHSIQPKVQGDVAIWFGSVPAVPIACAGNDLLATNVCKTNGSDNFDKIAFWKTPVADCGDGNKTCIPYSEWVKSYVAVLGGK